MPSSRDVGSLQTLGKSIYFQHNWDIHFNFWKDRILTAVFPRFLTPAPGGVAMASKGHTLFVGELIPTGTMGAFQAKVLCNLQLFLPMQSHM